ncbi:MAG: hypothetical protein AB7Q37_15930 [Pyrinomonadaceae bacterium]
MADRPITDSVRRIDSQSNEKSSALISTRPHKKLIDDVIVGLANSYENKRARQVTEWERAQPAYLRRAI